MTDLRKAAEMALEFVSWFASDDHSVRPKHKAPEIKEALRQALAQPEQESVICRNIYGVWAGSDGVPIPETIVEAYLLRLIEQMHFTATCYILSTSTVFKKFSFNGSSAVELRAFTTDLNFRLRTL